MAVAKITNSYKQAYLSGSQQWLLMLPNFKPNFKFAPNFSNLFHVFTTFHTRYRFDLPLEGDLRFPGLGTASSR